MEEKKECPICLRPNCLSNLQQYLESDGIINFTCDVCGKYQITDTAEAIFKSSDLDPNITTRHLRSLVEQPFSFFSM